jgi:hypothetical protein
MNLATQGIGASGSFSSSRLERMESNTTTPRGILDGGISGTSAAHRSRGVSPPGSRNEENAPLGATSPNPVTSPGTNPGHSESPTRLLAGVEQILGAAVVEAGSPSSRLSPWRWLCSMLTL